MALPNPTSPDGLPQSPRPPKLHSSAGGVFIALGAMGGAYFGYRAAQPTIGLLVGAAIGIVLAVLVWIVDARRR